MANLTLNNINFNINNTEVVDGFLTKRTNSSLVNRDKHYDITAKQAAIDNNIDLSFINAIDIDWNNAELPQENLVISNTGQLISRLGDTYTKSVIDATISEMNSTINTNNQTVNESITALINQNIYQAETITGLITTISSLQESIYTKSEADETFIKEHQDISGKANVGDSYTKDESDAKYLTEHQDITGKADVNHNHDGVYQPVGNYLIEHQSLENYATKDFVSSQIESVVGNAPEALNTLKEISDVLNGTEGENPTAGIIQTLAGKANIGDSYTKLESDAKYLTEQPDLSSYATKDAVAAVVSNIADTYQPKGNYLTEHQDISGKADVNHNHDGVYQPVGNYLTEHQSLEDYVTKAELGTFGTESEYNTFDYIYDEASWNDSFTNGVLKKYYTKYPDEDLWNPTAHRAANFNDKAYEASIYNDAAGTDLVKEAQYQASWASATAQKITNTEDANESYYLAMFYEIDENVYELFTDVALTTSANLYVKMNSASFPGCTQCWEGAVQAPGAKFPWICPNFEDDANVMIKFQYEGKDDVTPWNFSVFGKGPGHKEWGIASVAKEFGDDTLAITENGGEGAFDISKFKVIGVSANADIPAAIKAYIDTEIAKLKA